MSIIGPKGLVYPQIESQSKAEDLWPSMTWNDISGQYSGLLFRTEGNQSKPFGHIQQQSGGKRLSAINSFIIKDRISDQNKRIEIRPGIWSNNITLGLYRNKKDSIGMRVKRVKSGQNVVTPVNSRVWLWKAIQHIEHNNFTDIALPETLTETVKYLTMLHQGNIQLVQGNDHIHPDIPIGYIYPQLPHQSSPQQLWPSFNWSDISSQYSDHFFRVVVQPSQPSEDVISNSSLSYPLIQLQTMNHFNSQSHSSSDNPLNRIDIPSDGQWTRCVLSGSYGGVWVGLRLHFTSTEVRPINTAIRLWKRI